MGWCQAKNTERVPECDTFVAEWDHFLTIQASSKALLPIMPVTAYTV